MIEQLPGARAAWSLPGWNVIVAGGLDDVQNLLEALETAGFADRQVVPLGARRFAVAWR
jgi:hypothetical protein